MLDHVLEPIDRLHVELKSLSAAGIDVNLGFHAAADRLPVELDQVRTALQVRVSLGQSLEEAVAQEMRLPARYRAAVQAWIRLDAPAAVLAAITASTHLDRQLHRGLRLSLLQTAMTLVLICLGLALAALWLSPRIDAVYAQLNLVPTASAQWLTAARVWLPVWATTVTACFLIGALLWYRFGESWLAGWAMFLPMVRRRSELISHARFASYLATWLRHDLPLPEGLAFASALSPSDSVQSHPDKPVHITREARSDAVPVAAAQATVLPPLLNWAVAGDLAGESRCAALESVAEVYRRLADRQVAAWAKLLPMILTAVLCGLAVLLYGLGIFLPVIGLLEDVSAPAAY